MAEKQFAEEADVKIRAAAAASDLEHMAAESSVVPDFERGRFYDVYSARRNERLKRRKGGEEEDAVVKGTLYNLGVDPMPTKRRGTFKKKKAMVETTTTPRYSLRSTVNKDNKKPLSVAEIEVWGFDFLLSNVCSIVLLSGCRHK
ncbi:hypothetical protein IGI04_005021 [Brassica rapa subsp. trilocularis]|uniref:Uncharacterized protein n=1 Tax=Brassica rapa subsp. trilocularis TaxID=1813537 RepID=A0ABQ7NCU3_BRACM|nr:hypothetical protein IGI04_005021 [Brassica rapa subsp. trilocularis]